MIKRKAIRILIHTICFLTAYVAFGQPYYFKHYQVENGLSNNTVNCSIQDSKGFMWFGTKDGLNRFDGYQFKRYYIREKNLSMMADNIYSLHNDLYGNLWVGGEKGLYKYDTLKEQLVQYLDSFRSIGNIAMDKQGQLWFSSYGLLCRYNLTTNNVTTYPREKHFHTTSICLANDGSIWAAGADGSIYKYLAAKEQFEAHNMFSNSPPASSNWIQKVYPADEHSLLVATSNQGLKRYDMRTQSYTDVLTYNPDNTITYVRDILKTSPNEFWLATEYGIFILNTSSSKLINLRKKFLDPYSLSDNAIYTLAKDNEGGIWAGSYFGGINYYQPQYTIFQKYFPDNSGEAISGNVVREICEDSIGNLWVGTEDAGLNKIDKQTGTITHFLPTGMPHSIAYSNVHGLMVNGNDLWIGTFEYGIDIMDIRTGKVRKNYRAGPGDHDLKSNFPLCFSRLRDGSILVATSNGIFKYNPLADNFDPYPIIPRNMFVSCILEKSDGTVWVGTYGEGAYSYNPVTKERYHLANKPDSSGSLPNNTINALCEDSSKNLWLATEGGGLCKLNYATKTIKQYTTQNGLPSNFIFNVLEENKNSLWLTTSRGLVNFHPTNETLTVYTSANGLLNDQFNYHSGFKDAKGRLYFGSVKGMISFDPKQFTPRQFEPPVYITAFQVHNKELSISDSTALKQSILFTKELTLPYDQSSFSIDFAALSFASPEMTEYEYKMEGLDKEWIFIKPNRKVYFTNLSPGSYTFKVKATSDGKWEKKETQLTIKILPPFWATTWAYAVYIIIAAVILYYLISSYHTRIEDKKEKEIYEAKIDFFTNVAHEIRTPLTLIKGPVDNILEVVDTMPEIKDDVETMDRNTNRLMTLVSQILDFRQTETKGFSLEFNKLNLTQLVKEVYLDFTIAAKKRKLSYDITLPEHDIHTEADEEALRKIFSNLLSNAVKYAQQHICIKLLPLEKRSTHFVIEVTSDGTTIPEEMHDKIFEPFFRMKENIRQKGTGIGLALARSLAELHNGELFIKNTADGMNTFVLHIPLKPSV